MSEVSGLYHVFYHSKPAPGLTFYEGSTKVWASSAKDAEGSAKLKLKCDAFPERSLESWVIDRVTRIY